MGCNCGDNEYEIIVDNNGSCEPTTPEYYITLENVGVDGFSPTINQVNVTSSSFQLQITDVNGTETTGNIPLLSYLDDNFVTNTDLADTLTAYVTSTSLATTLTNYVTNTSLATTLADYVTDSNLTSTLANYVTNSTLSSTLSAYALDANVVHKAGTETITGRKVFEGGIQSNYIDTEGSYDSLSIGTQKSGYIDIGRNSTATMNIKASQINFQGTNIDITGSNLRYNNEYIVTTPVLADYVNLEDAQTITGKKTFTNTQYFNGGLSASSIGLSGNNPSIDTYNNTTLNIGNYNATGIQLGGRYTQHTIDIGYSTYYTTSIALHAASATLNGKDIATTNDIKDSTITFTQGGVNKGSFTLNQAGDVTIAFDTGGGGSAYTAGTGIDITNDTISIDTSVVAQLSDIPDTSDMATKTWVGNQGYLTSADLPTNYVTTDTAQTITGVKTFNANIKLNNSKAILTQSNYEALSVIGEDVSIGNDSGILWLWSSATRPIYNLSEYLALYSDIPTVNNPTITFTQGGTTKGTITLNQSSNQTIALDAGGGGGGAVIDDTVPSTTTVYSSQKTQDLINTKEDKFIIGEGIVLEEITHAIPNDLTSETSSSIVYADGYEGTYYPYMAFDGDENTKWGLSGSPSEQNPHWLVRDLGNTYPIARVVIKTESSNEVITGGYVQGSNDKTNWTNIGTIDNTGDTTKIITCDSTNRYRYIRLYCTSAKSGWGKVNEMNIYTSAVMTLSISPTILNQIADLQNRIAILEDNINGGNA